MRSTHTATQTIDRRYEEDEQPLGTCEFCGDDVFTESEMHYHGDALCVGGTERFDTREEFEGRW